MFSRCRIRHKTKGIMTNRIVVRGKTVMANGIGECRSQENHSKAFDGFGRQRRRHEWTCGWKKVKRGKVRGVAISSASGDFT